MAELKRKRDGSEGGGALPSDFFDEQRAPKSVAHGERRVEANNNNTKTKTKSVAESTTTKKEVAFDTFFTDIKADIVEIEKKEEEGDNALREDEDFEQLVSQGRAAVWRKLAEEKKEQEASRNKETSEKEEKGDDVEEGDGSDDDSGDDDALFDWRSKGI